MEKTEQNIFRIIRDLREKLKNDHAVKEMDISEAADEINDAYHPNRLNRNSKRIDVDYDKSDFRCAYLVKYPIHAAVLKYFLWLNIKEMESFLRGKDTINICCLGGGPATDAVGFSAQFCELSELSKQKYQFTAIDYKEGWKSVFDDVFQIADPKNHGQLGEFLKSQRVSHTFIHDDLKNPGEETKKAISAADILGVIKFVSILEHKEAAGILTDLFSLVKPGALIIFLDNSAGGPLDSISKAAAAVNFEQIGHCSKHKTYTIKGALEEKQWGVQSRYELSIAMWMWKKPGTFSSCEVKEEKSTDEKKNPGLVRL